MLLAHLSDLHVRGDEPIPWGRLLGKRATGYVNLRYRRGSTHKKWAVQALARELQRLQVDHVAITGDLSNLALEDEFAAVAALLRDDLGLPPARVSIVPGNHDLYTRGSMIKRRFAHYFGPYLASDLPGVAIDHPAGPFPFVRLFEGVALLGLASATPSPPLCAYGLLGAAQRAALQRVLLDRQVRERFVVGLLHHPPFNPPSPLKTLRNGLHDARELRACFQQPALLLHGHLHHRVVQGDPASILSCGATSASLLDERPDHRAGFNLYEIDRSGLRSSRALVLTPDGAFREQPLPSSLTPAA
ncbi:MAG: metallophosphoesterase [Polyangiaceae bacterium]|jgi:3',5'-cyclic AMP phosphodiesterase CpdA|nr:metallophosphoesterase [Polyangiaceae bacterium]